jgi:CheY-like chemotaxis protein
MYGGGGGQGAALGGAPIPKSLVRLYSFLGRSTAGDQRISSFKLNHLNLNYFYWNDGRFQGLNRSMSTSQHLRRSVLVVEDEPLVRLVATCDLRDAGCEVIEAENAEQALVALDEHPELAAMFTDINMPGPCDGLELARRVHDLRPDIRLVVTSGKVTPSGSELPPGARFLAKPYDGPAMARLVGGGICPPRRQGIRAAS